MSRLSVFLIQDNPLADKLLNGISPYQLALDEANSFCSAINEKNSDISASLSVVSSAELIEKIKESNCDIAVIHDSLRPLVGVSQFQRAFEALSDFDAVRPTMAFTETIKALDSDGRLAETIDREKVRRLSSPEVIKVSAIDFAGKADSWSVPLKAGVRIGEVAADPETIRINNDSDLEVIAAYLALNSASR